MRVVVETLHADAAAEILAAIAAAAYLIYRMLWLARALSKVLCRLLTHIYRLHAAVTRDIREVLAARRDFYEELNKTKAWRQRTSDPENPQPRNSRAESKYPRQRSPKQQGKRRRR
jgi:hypothetical protein